MNKAPAAPLQMQFGNGLPVPVDPEEVAEKIPRVAQDLLVPGGDEAVDKAIQRKRRVGQGAQPQGAGEEAARGFMEFVRDWGPAVLVIAGAIGWGQGGDGDGPEGPNEDDSSPEGYLIDQGNPDGMEGKWRTPREWAEADHDALRDRVRREISGRHNKFPGKMRSELERMADEAEKRGDLDGYVERLREMAETYARRAREGHRGGMSGRGTR